VRWFARVDAVDNAGITTQQATSRAITQPRDQATARSSNTARGPRLSGRDVGRTDS
jgi:hypothetical protein